MTTEDGGGVGVTFLSDYPRSDSYYRLRAFNGRQFEIEPHGTSMDESCISDVPIEANAQYNFQVIFRGASQRTNVRARVWKVGETRPAFQLNCNDTSDTRRRSGRFGIWSLGEGSKSWRSMNARRLR